MDDKLSQFDYLLNAMENAAAQEVPAKHEYAAKRQAVLAYVRRLEQELKNLREDTNPVEIERSRAADRNARNGF